MTNFRVGPAAPAFGTPEYRWWAAGAHAEDEARREGRAAGALEVAELVDGFGQHPERADQTPAEFAALAARVYCPGLPRRQRWRLAWELATGYPERRWIVRLRRLARRIFRVHSPGGHGLGTCWCQKNSPGR